VCLPMVLTLGTHEEAWYARDNVRKNRKQATKEMYVEKPMHWQVVLLRLVYGCSAASTTMRTGIRQDGLENGNMKIAIHECDAVITTRSITS
jgi:hypothetical protein